MAKAESIPIDPREPYAQAGGRIVRARTEELFGHADKVLDVSDIERVHDMRVASRRLRAVLEIFAPCWEQSGFKAEFKDVLRDVKQLADALGARRDPDVHIDALERFESAVSGPQRVGVRRLQAHLRLEQAHGNEVLAAALDRAERSGLQPRLLALADHAEQVPAP